MPFGVVAPEAQSTEVVALVEANDLAGLLKVLRSLAAALHGHCCQQ